jgi:hypothetical protein
VVQARRPGSLIGFHEEELSATTWQRGIHHDIPIWSIMSLRFICGGWVWTWADDMKFGFRGGYGAALRLDIPIRPVPDCDRASHDRDLWTLSSVIRSPSR